MALLSSLGSINVGGQEQGVCTLTDTRSVILSVSLTSVSSPRTPCVHAVRLPTGAFLQRLILGTAVFQTPTLKRPLLFRSVLIFWGGSPLLWLVPTCLRKWSGNATMQWQQVRVYDKYNTHWVPGFATLSQCLCCYTTWLFDGACWVFLPTEWPYHLYQIHFKERNCCFPCSPVYPQTNLPAPGAVPCFLPRLPPGSDF